MSGRSCCCCAHCAEKEGSPAGVLSSAHAGADECAWGAEATLRVPAMDCPVEEGMIREKLSAMSAVHGLSFNLMQRTVRVRHEEGALASILEALASLGIPGEVLKEERENYAGGTYTTTLRVPAMDCPVEERMIREKLSAMPGVRELSFNIAQRTVRVRHGEGTLPSILEALAALDMPGEVLKEERENHASGASAADTRVTTLRVPAMDCPVEERMIREKLSIMPGVRELSFNIAQRTVRVCHGGGALLSILEALAALDMPGEVLKEECGARSEEPAEKIPWGRLGIALAFALAAEVIHLTEGAAFWDSLRALTVRGVSVLDSFPALFALFAILLGGLATYRKGIKALLHGRMDMNVLMSVAVTGSVLIGDYPEAAAVIVLFNISEALESRAMNRTRVAVEELLSLAPDTALVLGGDGSWREMDVQLVDPGSRVRVRPGERIAFDGVVREGRSNVNQAPITGESMPVDKVPGDTVFAGTLNGVGALEIQVTADASESTLARIIRSVEEARGARAPIERFVDAFSKWYTPAVFLLAVLVAFVPPLFFSGAWKESVYMALVVLVTGCPCALVISTAVSVVSGLAAAARSGILVKGGLFMEQGRRLNLLALDKTGTITSGIPCQTDFISLDESVPSEVLAAALASRSDHPVSAAIARHAAERGLELPEVQDFEAIPGRGSCGVINGKQWYLGNRLFAGHVGADTPALRQRREALEAQGRTVVALFDEKGPRGIFGVADAVRESSRQAIRELHELGVKTVMLTGDNTLVAERIARETGVDDARGELMPEDKLSEISRLAADSGTVVGMVGDGINDAPALARAQIGFAMARGGTDTAIETANVALMDDDLRKVPRFIRLSRSMWSIMIQNIVFALGIKAAFLVLALMGRATMWMAVFADMGTTFLVVANALRILKK